MRAYMGRSSVIEFENGDSQPISAIFSHTVDEPFFEIGRQSPFSSNASNRSSEIGRRSPFSLEASVLGPVDRRGRAHGAKAIEQTDDEEDEAFVGKTDMVIFECAVFEAAAHVQVAAGADDVGCEGFGRPDGGRCQ